MSYGDAPRNTLDLYLPDAPAQARPAPSRCHTRARCPFAHPPLISPLISSFLPLISRLQGAPPAPVVIFVTGGMWIIGYKAWGALLASRLRAAGCVVACLDYRNFPQGTVSDMAADVAAGVAWVLRHARGWGGDASRCVLRACVRVCVCDAMRRPWR